MGFLWARGKRLRVVITAVCLQAFVLFGYDQGNFSGVQTNPDWIALFHPATPAVQGIIVASYNLGALIGCIVNFFVADRLGRRLTMWIAMCWIIVGAVLQASSFHVAQLVLGRIICGIGTGMETSTVPMYQSELCSRETRGRLVSAEVLFIGGGITIAYWFDFGMSYATGPIAWRLPIAFQIVFALFTVCAVFGVPESPRWLCRRGRHDDALAVLCAVRGVDSPDEYVRTEFEGIQSAIALEDKMERDQSLLSLFSKDEVRTRNRVGLAWLAQFANQLGGINLVIYYAPSLLMEIGMSPKRAQLIAGFINTMFMVGSIPPTFFLDRMGRRATMMWGSFGLAVSMLMIAALLSQQDDTPRGAMFGNASIAFFFSFMLVFGATVNCVPWVYVPEILPLKARTRGTAVGISSNWLWNFFVVMITPVIISALAWKAYLIFMCTNLAFIPMVYFLFPETSNVGLEDMDLFFIEAGDPVKNARRYQAGLRRGESVGVAARMGSISGAGEGGDFEKKKGIVGGDVHVESV